MSGNLWNTNFVGMVGTIRQIPFQTSNSKTITVTSGKVFDVSLPANATTGYKWDVTPSPGLTIVDEKYTFNCAPNVVGCGGQSVWTLNTSGPGTYMLKGVYQRPWEHIPAQTYTITIIAI
jgi:predicted secreted protein